MHAAAPDNPGLDAFMHEAARIRASGALGRSQQMQRLFEFLVVCRTTGRVPKEIEVAIDCFERQPGADAAQDATVRVTAHKLRKRLEDFYRDAGEPPRLTIPRGEYRLAMHASKPDPVAPSRWRRWLPVTRRERIATVVAAVAVAVALGTAMLAPRVFDRSQRPLADVRSMPLWASVLDDGLPVQLVLGDYYILGERDAAGAIRRLVREFDINSRQQLVQRQQADPEAAARYADMSLGYLPTSSAHALREVLPVVMASGRPVMLTLASELDPSTLKSTHIVYLGYLSGLGMLEDLVLRASRYSLGGSYDELIDAVTGAAHTSEAGEPHPPGSRYRDFAYLATLAGPGGHRHLIIAGTRDVGLMQAAEASADPARLREMQALAGEGAFEALYEVQGLNGINVEARLLEASPMDPQGG